MFTNIPLDLAVESVKNRWDHISGFTSIPFNDFIKGITLVLNSTFFSFNKKIYKQTFGTPMGSLLSPLIADIVLQDIENKAIETLPFKSSFFYRYVDDIILAAPLKFSEDILKVFNSFHDRLSFTLEIPKNNSINFLDVKIKSEEGTLLTEWCQKPTTSDRFLNFSSHPIEHKRGVIYGLVDFPSVISEVPPKKHNNYYQYPSKKQLPTTIYLPQY